MRKAIQHILATGREWQFAGYATDRWQLNQRVTLNLGVRYEYYPLMTRAGGKGIERYDPETNLMYLGGRGNVPLNAGIEVSSGLISPRAGLAIRVDDRTVLRGGFGLNYSPMPFSRPMRGQYPLTVGATFQRDKSFELFRSLSDGIPPVVGPELDTGVIEVPFTVMDFAVLMKNWTGATSHPGTSHWNVVCPWTSLPPLRMWLRNPLACLQIGISMHPDLAKAMQADRMRPSREELRTSTCGTAI